MKWYVMVLSEMFLFVCFINQGLQNKIIFSIYGKIKEFNMKTGNVSEILIDQQSYIHCFDYDSNNEYIYFPRADKNDILRFRYPSEQVYMTETVTQARRPIGVAIDPVGNHVYWTERMAPEELKRCNFDGSNNTSILQNGQLYALTLDYRNRWLYYSIYPTNSAIRRSRLNGTETQTVVNVSTEQVTGLSIDYNGDRLFWLERKSGDVNSSNFDGTNVVKIVSTNATNENLGIHVHNSDIYCANGKRILLVTLSPRTKANVIYSDIEMIYGVLFYKEKGKYIPDTKIIYIYVVSQVHVPRA
ncbi:low-density lipoprotein receptor-related protein 1B-like [Mytilus californianus]|uniref:low-density lipoprotein receptor-related protein 1B-like n=1 Tax=Mytilus californianus TaxID=6549 RepID=UPI002246A95A|nr:low-density lipoprotein receptor-related protein 1B-like [Mytilus californianus]XP_052081036.1 low-density lipoprotein receptor-related protein 1B-like [Mytilus californianus]XP_052081037.1 low-density lipoprotein receptor-related protein 1B-like [Mytilus californianus]